MLPFCNHLHNLCEYLEILPFRCTKFVSMKERNNLFSQLIYRSHTIAVEIFGMIVVTFVDENLSELEILFEQFKCRQALLSLCYYKLGKYLPSTFRCVVSKDTY